MQFDKLITMGCSWTAGEGDYMDKDNVTPGWVGRIFNKLNKNNITINDLDNLGVMGDSNWIQYAQLLKHLNQSNCLVIWGMTAFSRDIFYIDEQWHTSYVHQPQWRQYYAEYDDSSSQLKHLYLIHSFQQLIKQMQSQHFIFLSFDDISRFNGSYDLGKFNHVYNLIEWENIITEYSMCDYISQGNSFDTSMDAQEYSMGIKKVFNRNDMKKHGNFCYDGHPNSNGYELWANHLYDIVTSNSFNK